MKKITKAETKPKPVEKQKLPKRFSISEELLNQASMLVSQLPVRAAHKLLKSIDDNKVSEYQKVEKDAEKAPERLILPTEMLNDLLGFLTVYPVFISMELITMINMDLKIPEKDRVEPKVVEMDVSKPKK